MGITLKSLLVGGIFAATTVAQSEIPRGPDLYHVVNTHCKSKCVDPDNLMSAVYKAADLYQVDPRAMLAIIKVESGFKPKATNKGNVGLTQVLLRYHRNKFSKSNVYDVEDNVRVGTQIFRACLDKHRQDYSQSFRCYNGYSLGTKGYQSKTSKVYGNLKTVQLPTRQYLLAKQSGTRDTQNAMDSLDAVISFLHPS